MAFRNSVAALLIALLAASAIAQPKPTPKPPPALPPGVKVERDIAYVPNGDDAQKLDLYLPEKESSKPLPLIVWVHGGGWQGGSKSGCPAVGLVPAGYAAASVEYRFSQKAIFPAQIQDCQAAIRFLRANAKKYNIDPARVGAWGESAGGHLVALLGTTGGKRAFPMIGGNEDQSERVQAVVDVYGPTDFNKVIQHAAEDKNAKNIFTWNDPKDPYGALIGGGLGQDKAKGDAVSPAHYVTKDAPPFLILHGTKDTLVPYAQSEEFAASLKAAGVDVLLQRFPNAGHGGSIFWSNPVRQLVKAFFDKNLRGVDVAVEAIPEERVTFPPPVVPRQ